MTGFRLGPGAAAPASWYPRTTTATLAGSTAGPGVNYRRGGISTVPSIGMATDTAPAGGVTARRPS